MGKKQKQQKEANRPTKVAQSVAHMRAETTDPQGSWTGHPKGRREVPIQDADDL